MKLDCTQCGACCREAFDVVEIDEADPFASRYPSLVYRTPFDKLAVRREGNACHCLLVEKGTFTCSHYADRPQTCRDVAVGGDACLFARQRVGLPIPPPSELGGEP